MNRLGRSCRYTLAFCLSGVAIALLTFATSPRPAYTSELVEGNRIIIVSDDIRNTTTEVVHASAKPAAALAESSAAPIGQPERPSTRGAGTEEEEDSGMEVDAKAEARAKAKVKARNEKAAKARVSALASARAKEAARQKQEARAEAKARAKAKALAFARARARNE